MENNETERNLEVESRKPFNFLYINEIKGNNLWQMLPHMQYEMKIVSFYLN